MCVLHICLFCWQVTHFLPYLSTLWSSPTWLSIWQPCGILKAGRLWSFHPLRIKTSDYSLKDYALKARPLNHRMITAKIWLKRTGMVFSTYFHDDKSNVVLECADASKVQTDALHIVYMWCVKVHRFSILCLHIKILCGAKCQTLYIVYVCDMWSFESWMCHEKSPNYCVR